MYDHVLIRRLNDALLDAFNYNTLEQMLLFQLGKKLEHIVENADFKDTVFELVKESGREGWLNDLAQAAHAANSGNLMLAEVSADFLKATEKLKDEPEPEPEREPEPNPERILPSPPDKPLRPAILEQYGRTISIVIGGLVIALIAFVIFRPGSKEPLPVPTSFVGRQDAITTDLSGELIIWTAFSDDETHAVDAGFNMMTETYPDLDIQVQAFNTDEIGLDALKWQYMKAAETGDQPDIFLGPSDWGGEFSEIGIVRDPLPLTAQADLDRIVPSAINNLQYDGALVALPYSARGILLMRNRALLPNAPGSLEEIFALEDGLFDLEIGLYYSGATLTALGGRLMDDEGYPAFNTPEGTRWLETLKKFGDQQSYGNQDIEAFEAGEVALVLEGTWNIDRLADEPGAENIKLDAWPEGLSGWVLYDVAYVSAVLPEGKRDAVTALLSQLVSRRVQTELSNVGHVPVTADATIGNRLMREAQRVLRTSEPFPINPAMAQYWEPLTVAINTVVLEGDDPALTLEETANIIRARLPN